MAGHPSRNESSGDTGQQLSLVAAETGDGAFVWPQASSWLYFWPSVGGDNKSASLAEMRRGVLR